MKEYNKPILNFEIIEINDVITTSGVGSFGDFTDTSVTDLTKPFGEIFK